MSMFYILKSVRTLTIFPSSQAKGTNSTSFLTCVRNEVELVPLAHVRNEVELVPLACEDAIFHEIR